MHILVYYHWTGKAVRLTVYTVYADVLLAVNLYVDYILLLMTAKLTHSRLYSGRLLAASVLGSLSSLMLFLPPMPLVISALCRLLTAAILCICAFGFQNRRTFFWRMLCFVGSSFLMAGFFLAVSMLGCVRVMEGNLCLYPDVSLLHLVLFTIAAYLSMTAVQRIYGIFHSAQEGYRVTIRHGSCTASLKGIADTGNCLTDFLTGKPVIVCDRECLGSMVPPDLSLPTAGFRFLPYHTVSGSGMLAVFHPDEIVIAAEHSGRYRNVDALIGVGERADGQAIFHPRIL